MGTAGTCPWLAGAGDGVDLAGNGARPPRRLRPRRTRTDGARADERAVVVAVAVVAVAGTVAEATAVA